MNTIPASAIPVDGYMGAGKTIRSLLIRAQRLSWKPSDAKPMSFEQAAALANRHIDDLAVSLERERRHSAEVRAPDDWKAFCSWHTEVNLLDSVPSYPQGPWRHDLASVVQQDEARVLDRFGPEILQPPLFPVPGNAQVRGGMLVNGSDLLKLAPVDYRDCAWSLVCSVDEDYWGALTRRLSESVSVNPFSPLLELYEGHYMPLGYSDDRFVLAKLPN